MHTKEDDMSYTMPADAKQVLIFIETCPDCGGKHEIGTIKHTWWEQGLHGEPAEETVYCRTCNPKGKAVVYRDKETGDRVHIG